MSPSRQDGHRILQLPPRLIAGHASEFPNGVVWDAWDKADASLARAVFRRRHALREYCDAYREFVGPTGNADLYRACGEAVALLRALIEADEPPGKVGFAADEAARMILSAIRQDPAGASDLTDLLEGLADTLTERADTQFCVPHILVALALLLSKDGEPHVGMTLLDSVIDVLNNALRSGISPVVVARNLALAYCAKSDLRGNAGEEEESRLAIRRAWEQVQLADPPYQHFVIGRYRKVLEDQCRPAEVIHGAAMLAQKLACEAAGQPVDWILECI